MNKGREGVGEVWLGRSSFRIISGTSGEEAEDTNEMKHRPSNLSHTTHHTPRQGKMHSAVLANPSKYMLPAPHLGVTLQRYRDVGRKLFLCSNSGYEYVAGGMTYLLGWVCVRAGGRVCVCVW
jgi:hypothetical protein